MEGKMQHANDNHTGIRVLDLFSAAAGGWSLGMHRAGYRTIAACEVIDWRRALYTQNNPGVPVYDDVTTLTADRLVRDGVGLPDIIVGSPPCQDISSANTKGKGVDGERSSLYFEAVRLIDECRPRWFALENSANLRTRGADRVIDALAAIGYTCWPFVVSAGDVGANHERKRSWLVGFKISDANGSGWWAGKWWGIGGYISDADGAGGETSHSISERRQAGTVVGSLCPSSLSEVGCHDGQGDVGREASDTYCDPLRISELSERPEPQAAFTGNAIEAADDADAGEAERRPHVEPGGNRDREAGERTEGADRYTEYSSIRVGDFTHADQAGQADGCMVSSVRSTQEPNDGCGDGWSHDGAIIGQVGGRQGIGEAIAEPWSDWNGGLASHLRVDDGVSAWVAQSRIASGGPRGTAAASLIVEAFGDAVCPQIPEAIGRAILRVERAIYAVGQKDELIELNQKRAA